MGTIHNIECSSFRRELHYGVLNHASNVSTVLTFIPYLFSAVNICKGIIHACCPGFKISCSVSSCCSRSFASFKSLCNHVYFHHGGDNFTREDVSRRDPPFVDEEVKDPTIDDGNEYGDEVEVDREPRNADVQRTAAVAILKIRENHRLPQSVICNITDEIQGLLMLPLLPSPWSRFNLDSLIAAGVGVIDEATYHIDSYSINCSVLEGEHLTSSLPVLQKTLWLGC